MLTGELKGLVNLDDANLLAGRADQSDLRNADPIVDAGLSADVSSKVQRMQCGVRPGRRKRPPRTAKA
ncbi:hypothetical protein GCM10009638_04450 [Luteococcus sanguinis]